MNQLPNGSIAVGAPGSIARARAEREDAMLGTFTAKDIEGLEWTKHVTRYSKTKAFAVDITWALDHYRISLIAWQGDVIVRRFKANYVRSALSRAKQLINKY